MEAQGSCLTNKYAEGYPGKRWYGGCEFVDEVEQLAIDRAKELFGADHANVQPHSGSQANMAVYFSVLEPGDRILTMDLSHGGHLTHGHPMNFSGKLYTVEHYGVSRTTETIDYDQVEQLAEAQAAKMIVPASGLSAGGRLSAHGRHRQSVGALSAGRYGAHRRIGGRRCASEPGAHCRFVTTTTTHKTLRGPRRRGDPAAIEQQPRALAGFPGIQGGPLMHVIAAKAVAFKEALEPGFRDYQRQVRANAMALCEGMKEEGYRVVSGTTENHVMLIDLQSKGITGKDAQIALDHAGITVNKNAIPFDTQSPFKAGGIRLGSPAVTTRGMKEEEMKRIASWIHRGIENRESADKLAALQKEVFAFTDNYPLPY
jgi:glycine hydroxymethyltransferase